MPAAPLETFTNAHQLTIDAFLAVSKAYLQCSERLLALNIATLQTTLNDSASATSALFNANSIAEFQQIKLARNKALFDQALAYSRSVQEIAHETQTRFSHVISHSLSTVSNCTAVADSWQETLATLARSQQKLTAFGHGGHKTSTRRFA